MLTVKAIDKYLLNMKESGEWPFMFVPMNPLYHPSFSLCCALSSMGGHRCFLCIVTTTVRLKGIENGAGASTPRIDLQLVTIGHLSFQKVFITGLSLSPGFKS